MKNRLPWVLIWTSLALLLATEMVWAGAWTMKKGEMYNRFAFNYYVADQMYGDGGGSHDMELDGSFRDRNFNWYQEIGVSDRFTFISSLYYKKLSYRDDYVDNHSRGLGDAEFGLRYKIYEGPVVLSLQGLFKYGKFYDNESPEIGNRQNDYEVRLLLGKSLWPFPGYCNFELGYRYRDNDPADEVRYLAEVGMNFTKRFYGRVKLDGIWGMNNADIEKVPSYPAPVNPDFDLSGLLGSGLTPPTIDPSNLGSWPLI